MLHCAKQLPVTSRRLPRGRVLRVTGRACRCWNPRGAWPAGIARV